MAVMAVVTWGVIHIDTFYIHIHRPEHQNQALNVPMVEEMCSRKEKHRTTGKVTALLSSV